MTVNISITSDDIKKSQTISDFIGQALTDGGFTDVSCKHPPPFHKPYDGLAHQSRSALEVIQDTYPDFLKEPIAIRAIPVMGLDQNYDDTSVDTNTEDKVAFATTDWLSLNHGVRDTVIAFQEETHDKMPDTLFQIDGTKEVFKRAAQDALKKQSLDFSVESAAYALKREKVIDDAEKVIDAFDFWKQNKSLSDIVEAIRDETGYGDPPISESKSIDP